jgi:hypothetical protein
MAGTLYHFLRVLVLFLLFQNASRLLVRYKYSFEAALLHTFPEIGLSKELVKSSPSKFASPLIIGH